MKKSIIFLFLKFLCIPFFCSLGAASNSVSSTAASKHDASDEWMHAGVRRETVTGLIHEMVSLNGFELQKIASDNRILQAGRQTAYAKDIEVALCALAKVRTGTSFEMKFADIGSGLGTLGLLAPLMSDGLKPMEITLVEACEAYFKFFDTSLTGISPIYPPHTTFKKVTCMVQELPGSLAKGSFDAITCMNLLHLMDDAEQLRAIRDMRRLLKENGILITSCVACNAGIFEERMLPEPGKYMAKLTVDAERGGVENVVKEFISLSDTDETNYTPQAYYILEGGTYLEKSPAELLALASAGATDCYRYVHHMEKTEFLRMFSGSGFTVERSGEYAFCDESETSLFSDRKTGPKAIRGSKGFFVVARKILI